MLATLLVTLYFAVFALLCCYGMHRARLFYLCVKHKRRIAAAARTIPVAESDLPLVTIQLPLYNEATVAGRHWRTRRSSMLTVPSTACVGSPAGLLSAGIAW